MHVRTFADAVAVTPSDSAENRFSALYVGGAGNVAVVPISNPDSVIFTAVPAGKEIWLNVVKVLSTGTTATSIVGMR